MSAFNLVKARRDFPILSLRVNSKPLIYFDNAATTQKPRAVLEQLNSFYKMANANVHRGSHTLSNTATSQFEEARKIVAAFVNAPAIEEVLWCRGATEAINLVANSLGSIIINAGDSILVSVSEHHANIVPWQLLAERKNAHLIPIPLTKDHKIDQLAYQKLLQLHRPKIVALGHVSNALGTIHPVKEMIAQAQKIGAITLIDGAQAIAHLTVDVQELGCDFYCFSAHKCYGPTGIGVLWGRAELLNQMPPWQGGGEMIESVSFAGSRFNQLPFKFEAGTPPIADAIAFGAALCYLNSYNREELAAYEKALLLKLRRGCEDLPGVTCLSPRFDNVGILSFIVADIHHQDIAMLLDQSGIAVRSGHHCAMPLMQSLELDGTLRVSLSFYNSEQEVDYFLEALRQAIDIFSVSKAQQITAKHSSRQESKAIKLPSEHSVIEGLCAAKTWQQRFSYVLQLGEVLPERDENVLSNDYKLSACESAVWLRNITPNAADTPLYAAWSDARVMRGLLVMLLSCRSTAISDTDLFLKRVKLAQFLSPSRTNGVMAITDILKCQSASSRHHEFTHV